LEFLSFGTIFLVVLGFTLAKQALYHLSHSTSPSLALLDTEMKLQTLMLCLKDTHFDGKSSHCVRERCHMYNCELTKKQTETTVCTCTHSPKGEEDKIQMHTGMSFG
jgi:hypothetical protein